MLLTNIFCCCKKLKKIVISFSFIIYFYSIRSCIIINLILITGLNFFYRKFEHLLPKFMNKKWNKTHTFNHVNGNIEKFQRLYREKLFNAKRKSKK